MITLYGARNWIQARAVINLLKLNNGHIDINYNLVCTDFESNPNKEIAGRIQIDIAGKTCDFLNKNRMPIESCFHAVSTLRA